MEEESLSRRAAAGRSTGRGRCTVTAGTGDAEFTIKGNRLTVRGKVDVDDSDAFRDASPSSLSQAKRRWSWTPRAFSPFEASGSV